MWFDAPEGGIVWNIICFAVFLVVLYADWRVFEKAGQKGWKIIIPIYNAIIFLRIIKKPWWWIFLFIIPIVNIVFCAIALYRLAKAFGKSGGFAVGLFFLPFIFIPILGFGDSLYNPQNLPQ